MTSGSVRSSFWATWDADQVVLTNQTTVRYLRIKLMVLTEFAGIGHAELGVVATAPFVSDIVEHRGDVRAARNDQKSLMTREQANCS